MQRKKDCSLQIMIFIMLMSAPSDYAYNSEKVEFQFQDLED